MSTALRLVAEQRKRIGARIKELQPAASTRAIAKVVGANQTTVVRNLADANASPSSEYTSDINRHSAADDANASPTLSGVETAKLATAQECRLERRVQNVELLGAIVARWHAA
jgi:hypothetical protein